MAVLIDKFRFFKFLFIYNEIFVAENINRQKIEGVILEDLKVLWEDK